MSGIRHIEDVQDHDIRVLLVSSVHRDVSTRMLLAGDCAELSLAPDLKS